MGLLDHIKSYLDYGTTTQKVQVQPDASLTLGQWLEKSSLTPETVLGDSALLTRASEDLLAARHVFKPTAHQLHETRFALTNALKAGTWSDFRSPAITTLPDVEAGSDCCPGNVFFERDGYAANELVPEAIALSPANEYRLRNGYSDACLGQIISGTFISGNARSSNDFSHVYGDEAWECYLRTWTMLDDIPRGELLDRLDIDLVTETNRLVHAPDPRLLSRFFRVVGAITRGRMDVAGRIRDGKTVTQLYTFTDQEVEALKEVGIRFHAYPGFSVPEGSQRGSMEYPDPETIRDTIKSLIQNLKKELAGDDPDPIGAAAKFCRGFVALHPYEDSNGRTGRVLMNRLLEEFGYPPAILSNADNDLTMGADAWRQEVVEGIAHTKRYLEKSELFAVDSLLAREKITVPQSPPSGRVILNQVPFSKGADGFLYDVTGRPYLAAETELYPLSQLEYYLLVRRFVAMPPEEARTRLTELTAPNQRLLEAVASNSLPEDFQVHQDLPARKADSRYGIRGKSPVVKTIANFLKLENLDSLHLFKIPEAKGTEISSILSKYSQLDLEYWTVEKALKNSKLSKDAAAVHLQREELFKAAQSALKKTHHSELVSPQNPNGFRFRYEEIMFEASPLKYDTLSEAIAGLSDDHVTVWRGDDDFSKLLGLSPYNSPHNDEARKHGKKQFERHVVPHILQDLQKLESTGVGAHYTSHTSDLSRLAGRLVGKKTTSSSKSAGFRPPIPGGPATLPGPPSLNPPGSENRRTSESRAAARQSQKAFEIKVPKSSLLPGMASLSPSHGLANEQEMHGLERVSRREIYNSYTAEELNSEFVSPAASDK